MEKSENGKGTEDRNGSFMLNNIGRAGLPEKVTDAQRMQGTSMWVSGAVPSTQRHVEDGGVLSGE